MKTKLYKILGVVLTVVMLASLSVGLTVVPASASPDDLEWETYNFPLEGELGDWFWEYSIDFIGPMAQAIDGETLYISAAVGTSSWYGYYNIFKSDDDGRSWSVSKDPLHSFPDARYDVGDTSPIVDVVCSSEDANDLWVASDYYVYYSDDGGTTFAPISPGTLQPFSGRITSLDVGYIGGDPYLYVSTSSGLSAEGDVFFINQNGYPAGWDSLGIQLVGYYNVYAVNCAPDISSSHKIFALVCDIPGGGTEVWTNTGGVGAWTQFGDPLLDGGDNPLEIQRATNICFPDNFDDDELYVGVTGVGGDSGGGGVYRVVDTPPCTFRLSDPVTGVPDADIISLDLTGNVGDTMLLAGSTSYFSADYYYFYPMVFFSDTDGETWTEASKPPTGMFATFVLMDDDFASSGEAWAATGGDECGLSFTTTSGDLWNQISLIRTRIETIWDVSFYPNYCTSDSMFVLTKDNTSGPDGDDSLWRFDGTYWERVASETMLSYVYGISTSVLDMQMVQVSPNIVSDGTLYVTGNSYWAGGTYYDPVIFKSTDEGESWAPITCQPEVPIFSWVVIDEDTILIGSNYTIYKNTTGGRRCWTEVLGGAIDGYIMDLEFTGDTVLAVGYDSYTEVAISEDVGETWDMVGDPLPAADEFTKVAFDTDYDTNSTFYVSNDDDVYRCVYDDDLPPYAQEYTDIDGSVGMSYLSDIVTYNGCLYVSDWGDYGMGMWRCVNPTAAMLPSSGAPVFEQVGYPKFDQVTDPDAEFEYAYLWRLQATCNNTIWALDYYQPWVLWTFTDCLCCGIDESDMSPECGTTVAGTNSAYLSWECACAGDYYDVWVSTDEVFGACCNTKYTSDGCCLSLDDLPSGTTFWWKVRVAEDEPLLSKWSDVCSFSTQMGAAEWNPFQGPVSEYPYPGSSSIPIRPTFAWNSAEWATGYEFVLADNEDFTDPLVEETVADTVYALGFDLEYGTTYYWKVRAVSATSVSNWATGIFTTASEPAAEVWTCPICGLTFDTRAELEAHYAAMHAPEAPTTPFYIWVIVAIGAVLVIAVIVLIVTTRRTP
jgi:hypothetical protein